MCCPLLWSAAFFNVSVPIFCFHQLYFFKRESIHFLHHSPLVFFFFFTRSYVDKYVTFWWLQFTTATRGKKHIPTDLSVDAHSGTRVEMWPGMPGCLLLTCHTSLEFLPKAWWAPNPCRHGRRNAPSPRERGGGLPDITLRRRDFLRHCCTHHRNMRCMWRGGTGGEAVSRRWGWWVARGDCRSTS